MTQNREHPKIDELQLGEDPESVYPGDAHHWLSVYSELLRLVNEAVFDLGQEHTLSEHELEAYTQVFERRLAFWQEKTQGHEASIVAGRQAARDARDN